MPAVRAGALVLAVALASVVAVSIGAGREAVAGDAKVAEALFKSGKQAYQKSDFAGAATFFEKTLEETPELIEARWWHASAREKGGDKPAALASYRAFLALFDEKFKAGATISKEEQRLKGLADKSVDALSQADKEMRKLEDTYVASMISFAKDTFLRDPSMSTRAVEAVLAVRPEHEEAKKLLEKIAGGGGEAPAPAKGAVKDPKNPFAGVSKWMDVIAAQSFRSNFIGYAKGTMIVDLEGGRAIPPATPFDRTNPYCVEFEIRCAESYKPGGGWTAGVCIAWKNNDFESIMMRPGRVVLSRNYADGRCTDVSQHDIPQFDGAGWHKVGVVVRGPSVEIWYGGKSVITWKGDADLGGGIAICMEGCKTEWRLFRAGNLD
jgi:hypothetical protein